MKKFFVFYFVLVALIGLYPRSFTVLQLDTENDCIVLEDCVGFLWEYDGIEDWEIGDHAAAIMYDNNTDSILDDEIISLLYQG